MGQGSKRLNGPPPEKVEFIAPIMFDSALVLKKFRKFSEAMTFVMTPES